MAESFVHEFQSDYEKLLISDPMTHGPLIVFLYIGLIGFFVGLFFAQRLYRNVIKHK